MARKRKPIVINAPPTFKRKKTKKPTFSIQVETEPLIHDFDALGKDTRVVEAVKKVLQDRIRDYGQPVKASTQARRDRFVNEFQSGKRTAVERFGATRKKSGELRKGGFPDSPPLTNRPHWFQHSGRLIDGMAIARAKDGEWRINVTANRLDATTFGDLTQFQELLRQLEAVLSPRTLPKVDAIVDAITAGLVDMIHAKVAGNKDLRRALSQSRLAVARGLLSSTFGGF